MGTFIIFILWINVLNISIFFFLNIQNCLSKKLNKFFTLKHEIFIPLEKNFILFSKSLFIFNTNVLMVGFIPKTE